MTNSSIDINVNMRGGINVPRGMNNYGGGGISNNRNAILAQGYSGIAGSSNNNNNNDNRNMSSTLDRQFMYNFMNNSRNTQGNVGGYPVGAYNSLSLDNPNNPKSPYHPNNIRGAGGSGNTRGYGRNPILSASTVGGSFLGGASLSSTLNTAGGAAVSMLAKSPYAAGAAYLATKAASGLIGSASKDFDRAIYSRRELNQFKDYDRKDAYKEILKYRDRDIGKLERYSTKRMLNTDYINNYVSTEFSRSGNLRGTAKESTISAYVQGQQHNVTQSTMANLISSIGDVDKLPETTHSLGFTKRNWENNSNEFVKILTKMVTNLKNSGITDPDIFNTAKDLSQITGETRFMYADASKSITDNLENAYLSGGMLEVIAHKVYGGREGYKKAREGGIDLTEKKQFIKGVQDMFGKDSITGKRIIQEAFSLKSTQVDTFIKDILKAIPGKDAPRDGKGKKLDTYTDKDISKKFNIQDVKKNESKDVLRYQYERLSEPLRENIAVFTTTQKVTMDSLYRGVKAIGDSLDAAGEKTRDFVNKMGDSISKLNSFFDWQVEKMKSVFDTPDGSQLYKKQGYGVFGYDRK